MARLPPNPDASLEQFVDGLGVLSRDWSDGTRERAEEDYPPWTTAAEMKNGYLDVVSPHAERAGRYEFVWLSAREARERWERLGISHEDF